VEDKEKNFFSHRERAPSGIQWFIKKEKKRKRSEKRIIRGCSKLPIVELS
jgi:hypothetical protein